jgi:integrase
VKLPAKGEAQVEIADGGCPGLRLRLSPSVARWLLGCRDATGKARRFYLGTFPEMGLKAAREAARDLRVRVRQGYDPVAEARARRQAVLVPDDVVTLGDLLDTYAALEGRHRRSWPKVRRYVETVFCRFLGQRADQLGAAALQLAVDAWPSAASASNAVRTLRPVLKWAAKRGLVSRAIVADLEPPAHAQRPRERVLTREEIRAVLAVLDATGDYGHGIRWLLWTCCRLNEACDMRWRDVNLGTGVWSIPVTKTGRPHTVPLPRQALDFLQERFAQGKDLKPADRVFSNAYGNKLTHWHEPTQKIHALSHTTGWHRHDLRRSGATLLGGLGVPPHVIEIALNHTMSRSSDGSTVGRIASVYNRARYGDDHARALQKLADELDAIASDEATTQDRLGAVIRLRA